MAKKKAEEFIEKIETPEAVAVVGADGEPIAVSGVVPQESTDIDTETRSETAVSSEEEKSDPVAETADNDAPDAGTDEPQSADADYDPFLFPVDPEAITFAVSGTGHSHKVIDGHVSCEECHGSLYPDPVVEIESYSFDASEQDS